MKKNITPRVVLIATLFMGISMGLSSCIGDFLFGPKLHYPHFLTAFVEPNDFRLEAIDSDTKGRAIHPLLHEEKFLEICKIEMQGSRVEYNSYDRQNSKIVHFLSSIGDTCYFKHTQQGGRIISRHVGIISVPKEIKVTCNTAYDKDHGKGASLNDVAALSFLDNLSYIKREYDDSFKFLAMLKMKDPMDLNRLLASHPWWILYIKEPPTAWMDKTITFTVSMTLSNGNTISRQVDIKFPLHSK